MTDAVMYTDDRQPMGFYVTGRGRVKSIWHESWTGVQVIEAETITPEMVPSYMLGDVRVVVPVDPETFDPVEGLGLIKVAGVSKRLGHAGGRKRVNWTPCQPREVYSIIDQFRSAGASVESMTWVEPGRYLVDGQLPMDDATRAKFGDDAHDVRFCAIANYTGQGTDVIVVSLVRVVCQNTERAAVYSANKAGNILKIRHSKDVADRWDVDVPAFLGDYSTRIAERAEAKLALGAISLGDTANAIIAERDRLFSDMVGGKPDGEGKALTFYARKLEALKTAWHAERENARTLGINPDSRRVVYEAFTNVMSHGGIVTVDATAKLESDRRQWRPVLNSARSEAGRALSLLTSDESDRALALALA